MSRNPVVHIEIPSKDRKKNSKFYRELFDWELTEYDEMDYTLFDPKEGPGGGFPTVDGDLYKTDRVLVYMQSDDIDADLKKIEALGGKTILAKTVKSPGLAGLVFSPTPKGIHWRCTRFKSALSISFSSKIERIQCALFLKIFPIHNFVKFPAAAA